MTSQVAVYNALGVGIASDTVATQYANGAVKTVQNSEKIVPLPDGHRVAVIFSGNYSQNDVNIRLLLNEWSVSLRQPFNSIPEYQEDFLRWLTVLPEAYLPLTSEMQLVDLLVRTRLRRIRAELWAWISPEDGADVAESKFQYRVARNAAKLREAPRVKGLGDDHARVLLQQLPETVDSMLQHYLGEFVGFKAQDPRLAEIVSLQLSRFTKSSIDTTLGFVGFGASDLYAQDVKLALRGRYGGQAVGSPGKVFGGHAGGGAIHTFAQDDAIWGFLRGVYPQVLDAVSEGLRGALASALPEADDAAVDQVESAMFKHLSNFQQESLVNPLLTTVDALSLHGLAELAGTLVGMQAARSAAMAEPASVGGLIETAVIDRRDGFRWQTRLP